MAARAPYAVVLFAFLWLGDTIVLAQGQAQCINAAELVDIMKSPEFQQSWDRGPCDDSDTGGSGCDIECMASIALASTTSDKWQMEKNDYTFGPDSTCMTDMALDIVQYVTPLSDATGLSLAQLTGLLPCFAVPAEREKWMATLHQRLPEWNKNQQGTMSVTG